MSVLRTAKRLLPPLLARAGRLRAGGQAILHIVGRCPPLARLHAALARLPPLAALLLFLVPELCNRTGWVVSVWLLLSGHPGRAMAIYAATKVLAGGTALWIYVACEPALLRIPLFAALHRVMGQVRRAVLIRLGFPPADPLMMRNAAQAQAPATALPPTGLGRTK
jgi:hypothetical protein